MAFISLSGGYYTFEYDVSGTEGEGAKDISISLQDMAGNLGSATQATALFFDFTPVAVQSFAVTPLHAKSGTVVTASFRVDEPCAAQPEVGLGIESMTFASLSGGAYTYTYQVSGTESEGAKDIEISTEDMAGNASIQQQPGAVWFDFTPPGATILEVTVR